MRSEYAALAYVNAIPGLEAYLPEETRKHQTARANELSSCPPSRLHVGGLLPRCRAPRWSPPDPGRGALHGRPLDRFGRRRTLIWALVLYAIAGVMPMFLDDLGSIIASRVVVGAMDRSPSGGIHPIRSTAAARTTAFARLSVSTRW